MLLSIHHFYQSIILTQLSEKSYLNTKQLSIFVGNKAILSKHVVQVLDDCTQTDGQS